MSTDVKGGGRERSGRTSAAVSGREKRAAQGAATRAALLEAARELFGSVGFADTSLDEVVARAHVTKGALYHHFSGKDALFRAVYEAVLADVVSAVMTAAGAEQEAWASVRAGLSAFLDACLDAAFRRIVILESVSVLHPEVREAEIGEVELPMLRTVLTPLAAGDTLPGVALDPLAHVALGGLYGAALFIARSPDPSAARRDVDVVLDTLIGGLCASRA